MYLWSKNRWSHSSRAACKQMCLCVYAIVEKLENTEKYKENAHKCTITAIPYFSLELTSWFIFLGYRRYTFLQKVWFTHLV